MSEKSSHFVWNSRVFNAKTLWKHLQDNPRFEQVFSACDIQDQDAINTLLLAIDTHSPIRKATFKMVSFERIQIAIKLILPAFRFNELVFEDCQFNGCAFSNVSMTDVEFRNCTVKGHPLLSMQEVVRNFSVTHSVIDSTQFEHCRFEGITFDDVALNTVGFLNCQWLGSDNRVADVSCTPKHTPSFQDCELDQHNLGQWMEAGVNGYKGLKVTDCDFRVLPKTTIKVDSKARISASNLPESVYNAFREQGVHWFEGCRVEGTTISREPELTAFPGLRLKWPQFLKK